MECSCDASINDAEYPEVFKKKIRKARKKHSCNECRRSIYPGEEYEHCSGKWDGAFETYKTCIDCLSLRDQFFSHGWCYRSLWPDFLDTIHEWGYEVPESCISELTPKAREKVCKAIEEGWEYSKY